MVFTRENEETKEELLKEIEELHRRINDLEKLQNKSQNVKEGTERYLDPLKEAVTTSTPEPTNVNEQLLRGINSHQKAEGSLLETKRNYKEISAVIPVAFVIADDEGRIVFWNKAADTCLKLFRKKKSKL